MEREKKGKDGEFVDHFDANTILVRHLVEALGERDVFSAVGASPRTLGGLSNPSAQGLGP